MTDLAHACEVSRKREALEQAQPLIEAALAYAKAMADYCAGYDAPHQNVFDAKHNLLWAAREFADFYARQAARTGGER